MNYISSGLQTQFEDYHLKYKNFPFYSFIHLFYPFIHLLILIIHHQDPNLQGLEIMIRQL